MATLVGKQLSFESALKELAELEHDTIDAYNVAIGRLENKTYKTQIEKFRDDHQRHLSTINKLLVSYGKRAVNEAGAKSLLTMSKVLLADMVGDDNSVLKAMLSNEQDTNTAYERINEYEDKWHEAGEDLKEYLEDERRHKKWFEEVLKHNK